MNSGFKLLCKQTLFTAAFVFSHQTLAADSLTPGALVVEPPTLISLGFEWEVEGDENRNAAATIEYRAAGSSEWQRGLDLLRLQNERSDYLSFDFITPNMFAGSLFDLTPDTEYEVRLTLSDPDGVTGTATQTVMTRTRPEPLFSQDGQVYHVYPPGHEGPTEEPSFRSFLSAYYTGSSHSDWAYTFPPRVQPGDTILIHAGLYKDNRFKYGSGQGTPFDGTYFLTQSGTAEKPIIIKAAGDGPVVFDGDDNHILFNVMAADYNHFQGITIRNTDVAFLAGQKNIAGAVGLAWKDNLFENVGVGISTNWAGSKDFYIADNTLVGRHNPRFLMGWLAQPPWRDLPGFPALVTSNFAIKVYGSGHVIAFNRVEGFHDGIDHATYGKPEEGLKPVSIDIYNNDIFNVSDNCIEADGAMHNIRIFRNRCLNHGHRALSTQPVAGGPVYFFRNIVYNAPQGGTTKYTAESAGILSYNNTLIGEVQHMGPVSNIHFRNNLILGQGAYDEIFTVDTFTNYSSSDYNGFMPNSGVPNSFGWNSPAFDTATSFGEDRVHRRYSNLQEYQQATGQDLHSVIIDYGVFQQVSRPDPADVRRLYHPDELDFALRSGTAAIDAGVELPNITDGYSGKAPDLGALEYGAEEVHYGPRK